MTVVVGPIVVSCRVTLAPVARDASGWTAPLAVRVTPAARVDVVGPAAEGV